MRTLWRQLGRFAVVGALSTVLHLALFALFHLWCTEQWANVVALTIATVFNTTFNRAWTFDVQHGSWVTHQAQAFGVLLVTWAATSGSLALLYVWDADPPVAIEVLALAGSTAVSTSLRFLVMRSWTLPARALTDAPRLG